MPPTFAASNHGFSKTFKSFVEYRLNAEIRMPLTFHVSTGRDPRAVGGNGGAIINYVCHSMETTIEPLVQMITSGVFERHPDLQCRHRGRRAVSLPTA